MKLIFDRPNAQSTDDLLSFDTIMCSVGAKYKEYNTNVVRTLFINADKVNSIFFDFFNFRRLGAKSKLFNIGGTS